MARIDEMPEYQAQLGRTGHSLSHDFAFTAAPAYLLPVFHDFLNAGESVNLGFDFLLRTQPLEAAAMSKIKCHTEYFFVPMQLMYQGFSDWYYGIREEFSSRFLVNELLGEFKLPLVNLTSLFTTLNNSKSSGYLGSGNSIVFAGESVAKNAYRFFDMLGYRPTRIADGSTQDGAHGSVFPYPVLAYNCIYQNYYRLDNRELFRPDSFNVDRYFDSGIIDYGKFAKDCLLRRRPFDNDYWNDIKVSPIVDVLNLNNKSSLDAAQTFLTRGVIGSSGVLSAGQIGDANLVPFQNFNPSNDIATQFGMNGLPNSVTKETSFDSGRWKTINNLSLGGSVDIKGSDDHLYEHSGDGTDVVIKHDHSYSDSSVPNGLDIGTANIRAMFASEKLWSVTGRAKKKYDDQTLAHFGFKVPHDPKHEISIFGHDEVPISIGEVISTSNTASGSSGSPLGEIAGKGYAAQGNQRHKFTAPCHGVVMVLFSIVPEEYYQDTFLKVNKISTREDLYTPEFDHLGMQPLFGYEHQVLPNFAATINGWQYRYEQWKRRYNRVTSVFGSNTIFSTGSLASWIHTIEPFYGNNIADSPNAISYNNFLHMPNELNDLFLYQYTTGWSSAYESNPAAIYEGDPFVVSSHIDCVKVSTMSDYSLPRLDA